MRKILTPIQRYGRVMRTFLGKKRATLIDHAENWLYMRDAILAFYMNGPEWPPPECANKTARDKKPDRDSICKLCRTVIPPGENRCPQCGTVRPVRSYGGTSSKLERVDGTLKLIDSVTGEASLYGGDLWPEVCTEAFRAVNGDEDRARKRAIASYKAITGRWPPTKTFRTLDRESDPAVADLMRRNFQAWMIAKKMSKRGKAV